MQQLFTDLFIYGSIFSQAKLGQVFEAYKARHHEEAAKTNQKEPQTESQGYGVMLVEHLRSNLDLSKVNIAGMRRNAMQKPWAFV